MIRNAFEGIRIFLGNVFRTRKDFFAFAAYVILCGLIFLNSGNAYISFGASFYESVIPYIVLLLLVGSIFVLRIDINYVRKQFSILKTKSFLRFFDPLTTLVLILLFAIIMSMAINPDLVTNLNSYIGILFAVSGSYFVAKIVTFDKFVKFFIKSMVVISLISIVIFAVQLLFDVQLAPSYFFNESRFVIVNNFYFLYFEAYTTAAIVRLSSIFWEPGVFATFLIIATILQLVFSKKINWLNIALFVVCIVLTQSTAGYVLLIMVFIMFVSEKIKEKHWVWFFLAFMITVILLYIFYDQIIGYLAEKFPSIFGKFVLDMNNGVSLSTRLLSPYYYFLVFLKNPFFGFGGTTAISQYYLNAPAGVVDAGTSSSTYMLAAIGFFGIIYTLIPIYGVMTSKRLNIFSRFFLCLIILALMNKENQTNILAVNIFYFIFLTKSAREREGHVFPENPSKKTLLSLFASKTENGAISRNIIVAFIIKGLALVVGFITIPIYNSYFGDDNTFGVWLVIVSVLLWILTFDLGLGNGLKNKLIEAMQKGEKEKIKTLISSTYISTAVVSGIFLLVGAILTFVLDFNVLFNITPEILSGWELRVVILIVLLGVCFEFILKNVIYIMQALQKSALSSSLMLISNGMLLTFAAVFSRVSIDSKFLLLAIVYALAVNLPLLVANFIIFSSSMKGEGPSIKFFNMDSAKQVMKLGLVFFILQLVTLFIWSFNEIIISNLYGTAMVTEYTKYYKIFGFMGGILGTVIQYPIWTAVSKAYVDKNAKVIKKMHVYCLVFAAVFFLINVVVGIFLQDIFDIWLGEYTITVQPHVVWIFIAYSAVFLFSQATVIICNAIEALKYLLIINIAGAVLKLPLTYLLHYFFAGSISWEVVILVNSIIYLPNLIIPYLEIRKKIKFGNQDVISADVRKT